MLQMAANDRKRLMKEDIRRGYGHGGDLYYPDDRHLVVSSELK